MCISHTEAAPWLARPCGNWSRLTPISSAIASPVTILSEFCVFGIPHAVRPTHKAVGIGVGCSNRTRSQASFLPLQWLWRCLRLLTHRHILLPRLAPLVRLWRTSALRPVGACLCASTGGVCATPILSRTIHRSNPVLTGRSYPPPPAYDSLPVSWSGVDNSTLYSVYKKGELLTN